MKRYILQILAISLITSFIACNDDDKTIINDIEKAKSHAGFYKGKMKVLVDDANTGEMWQQAEFGVLENRIYLEIESLWVKDIYFGNFRVSNLTAYESDGALIFTGQANLSFENIRNVNVTIEGVIKDSKMNLDFAIKSVSIPSIYSSMDAAAKRDTIAGEKVAQILNLKFEDERILIQPEINEEFRAIRFFVRDTITTPKVELKPLLTLNEGASVIIDGDDNDSTIDFANGDAYFTVYAPDLIHRQTYNVRMNMAQVMQHELNAWEVVPADETDPNLQYSTLSDPIWQTDNESLRYLKTQGLYSPTAPYLVEEISDAVKGKVAKITNKYVAGATPALQIGLLYTGEQLQSSISDPLPNVKYGTAFKTKPIRIEGHLKYTAGTKFYNNGAVDASAKDSCLIAAVLYEIAEDGDYLDGTNIFEDDRVVGIGRMVVESTTGSGYRNFYMNLGYRKSYYFTKKYKLAIICTPSHEGFLNKGAENSTLWIDDLQVFSQDDYR